MGEWRFVGGVFLVAFAGAAGVAGLGGGLFFEGEGVGVESPILNLLLKHLNIPILIHPLNNPHPHALVDLYPVSQHV